MKAELKILYENTELIALYKPPGIATQTKNILSEDMVSLVRKYIQAKGGDPRTLEPVHRLDQPAAGILVFAKNKDSFRELSAQFAGHDCDKGYLASVEGSLKPSEKEIHLVHYIRKKEERGGAKAVLSKADESGARRAELFYRVSRETKEGALLNIRLLTGRFHQIRAQLSAIGHPIIGDVKYGYKGPGSGSIGLICNSLTLTLKNGERLPLSITEKDAVMVDFLDNYG